jgi:hypothetical protein
MREIHGIAGCITPSRVIILRTNCDVYLPMLVIDRMNPGTPQKLLETPGMKYEDYKAFNHQIQKYNNLMVVVEPNVSRGFDFDDKTVISFWDLRDEPYIFKVHNILDMVPSEILSEYELLEGSVGRIFSIWIQLSRAIMAVAIQLEYCVTPYQYPSFKSVLLLYRVNTTEPSQDAEGFHLLKTVKLADNIIPPITMNDKYLIHEMENFDSLEVHEIETLLSSMDTGTRFAPRKILPILDGEYVIEPGMSDRLAVFDREENRLTIFDLVSRNPTTILDTIQWSIIGQPSQKNVLSDGKLKIQSIGGNWCCGSFLILQRLELPNAYKKHRQWTFKLNIVDPGTVEKRPEVISQIKDIFDSKISYPRRIKQEECYIDAMGIVYVVIDSHGKVDYLTVNCAQFHNINAAQAGSIRALEDSSSDNLCGLNAADEVVNWMGKEEEGMGEDEEGKMAEEKVGKEKGDGFYPGNFLLIYLFLAYTITNIMQD